MNIKATILLMAVIGSSAMGMDKRKAEDQDQGSNKKPASVLKRVEDEKKAKFALKLYPGKNKWCVGCTTFGTGREISGDKGDMVRVHRVLFEEACKELGLNGNYDDIFGEDRSILLIIEEDHRDKRSKQ